MNAQEFKAYGPRGEFIDGSDAHAEFLSVWFKDNQPKWRPNITSLMKLKMIKET